MQSELRSSSISARKRQHLELSQNPLSQVAEGFLNNYRLPYVALPEINLSDVHSEITLFGRTMSQPLVIGAMTGGIRYAHQINENLATAAGVTGVALCVGSQRIALDRTSARDSFGVVRRVAPNALIFANMGAVQLNYGRSTDDYKRVVDMIRADALYLHVNPLQEALQVGGDTNYADLISGIERVVKCVEVPVFVKEVGHGLDVGTALRLAEVGVSGIDTAGVGGTSWAWIEAANAGKERFMDWFKCVGLTNDELALKYRLLPPHVVRILSGGVRSPVDAVKGGIVGMDLFSMAQPFVKPAMTGVDDVIELIHDFGEAIRILLFVCGVQRWNELPSLKLVKSSCEV